MGFEGMMPFVVRCVLAAGAYAGACWLGWTIL